MAGARGETDTSAGAKVVRGDFLRKTGSEIDSSCKRLVNLELEQAILGGLLLDNTAIGKLSSITREDFSEALHAEIFDAACKLIAAGKLATPITLKTFFESAPPIRPDLSVPQYLGSLVGNATSILNLADYAETLRDLNTRRAAVVMLEEAAARARNPEAGVPVTTVLDNLNMSLDDLRQRDPLGQFGISAGSYRYRPAADISPRDVLYGQEIRGLTSTTVGRPGVGKTKLIIGETLAKVVGRQLLHDTPRDQYRCWAWFGEECADDIDRLFTAAMDHHGLTVDDIGQRLFVSARDQRLVVASQTRDGLMIARPVVDAVKRFLRKNRIDSVIIDPFVKSHEVGENDNVLIDKVVGIWSEIAHECSVHVHLYHHNRKTGGADLTVEDVRGGGAIVGAVRSVRILNAMTKEDAEKAEVDPAWAYIRLDDAKQNNLPPAKARWMRLVSVDLAHGDTAGVATAWSWPDPFSEISVEDTKRVQKAVADGEWRASSQAADWVGKPVADALGLDLEDKAARKRVKGMIETWIENGVLREIERHDEKRRPRKYVEVGKLM
jgi:AAA domain/DnaB-like helicase N terminal domain